MSVEIGTFQPKSAITKLPIPNPSSRYPRRNFDGSTLANYPVRENWIIQLSDDLLLFIFLKSCDRISAFNAGLACKKLLDIVHGEFYRKAAQDDQEIARVVMWTAQRGTLATLERLSYHLPPGKSLSLDTHTDALRSPVTWGQVKRYPNGNLYRHFSQIDYARGQNEKGLVDLNGDLLNGKCYSHHLSVVLRHGLGGWAPIHIAALFGNANMVEYLVGRGFSIGSKDESSTPRSVMFYAAVSEQSADILPCMVRLGADINQKVPNGRRSGRELGLSGGSSVHMPLLAYLCDERYFPQALALLRAGARANYKTSHRKTLLHLCTAHANNHTAKSPSYYPHYIHYHDDTWAPRQLAELIRALIIEGGVDPNAQDTTGNTFLHYAAKNRGPYFVAACEALASLVSPYPTGPVLGPHGGGGPRNNNNQENTNSKILFNADAQNRRGETVLMAVCDREGTALHQYEGPAFFASTNSSSSSSSGRVSNGDDLVENERPAPGWRTAIKVFLKALRPSMGPKDSRGFRVADRIAHTTEKRTKRRSRQAEPWQHPVKPYLLAYVRDYLQVPALSPSSGCRCRQPTSSGGGSSSSSGSSNDGGGNHGSGIKNVDSNGMTEGATFEELMELQEPPSLVFPVGPPTKGWRKMEIDGVLHWQPDPNPGNIPWTVLTYYNV